MIAAYYIEKGYFLLISIEVFSNIKILISLFNLINWFMVNKLKCTDISESVLRTGSN